MVFKTKSKDSKCSQELLETHRYNRNYSIIGSSSNKLFLEDSQANQLYSKDSDKLTAIILNSVHQAGYYESEPLNQTFLRFYWVDDANSEENLIRKPSKNEDSQIYMQTFEVNWGSNKNKIHTNQNIQDDFSKCEDSSSIHSYSVIDWNEWEKESDTVNHNTDDEFSSNGEIEEISDSQINLNNITTQDTLRSIEEQNSTHEQEENLMTRFLNTQANRESQEQLINFTTKNNSQSKNCTK